jgi:lipoyl(octanoyl) transferase
MAQYVQKRIHDEIPNTLLLVRHPAVYTLGRGIQTSVRQKQPEHPKESLESLQNCLPHPVLEVERGGGITFHDEGQIIGYPIVKLNPKKGFGISAYLRTLEEFIISSLQEFFPHAPFSSSKEATGIWLENKKVVSFGIAIRRWVTYHGFAIHIHSDLSAFQKIRPCGLEAQRIANLPDLMSQHSKYGTPWPGGGAVGGPDERPQARRAEDVDREDPERQDPQAMGSHILSAALIQTLDRNFIHFFEK